MNRMCLLRDVKEGAYIEHAPTMRTFILPAGDGVKGEHVFHPSEVKRWRVFRNERGIVELIPAESAGRLTVYGRAGWRNIGQLLQSACEVYADGQYALEARSLGMTFNDLSIPTESIMKHCRNGSLNLFTDHGYASDLQQMQKGVLPPKISWFASRYVKKLADGYALNLRVSFGNRMGEDTLAEMSFDGVIRKEYEKTFDICPVRTMAYNIIVSDGDGTEENPYHLALSAY